MKRKKVLLVDDSRTILMIEGMILRQAPYEVLTARDGEEAVEKATNERPDLILLDVVMPKMDGFEVCRRLRRQKVTKAVPIIIVTTRGEAEYVEEGFRSGCSDYLTKPIDGPALLSKLKSHLGE